MSAGSGLDGQGEHLLVHQTVTVLHFERLADQNDRHVGRDHLIATNDLEVDVGHRLGDRVSLHLAGQRQVGRALCHEGEQLVRAGLTVEGDAQLAGAHSDRDRVGPVAVDDAGDLPLPTQAARGA